MDDGKPGRPVSENLWRLASLGTELAGAVIGGCLLGWWIDLKFNTSPWAVLIGASIGIVGGLYNLIRQAVHESLEFSEPARGRDRGSSTADSERSDGDRTEPPAKGGT